MKPINLDDLVEGSTYYIQIRQHKFKAIFDKYEKSNFKFKKIIRLNTPCDWPGQINIYEYMNYKIFQEEKTKIQLSLESRAIQKILENITGTKIY